MPPGIVHDQPIDPELLTVLPRVAVTMRLAELLEQAH